EAGTRDGGPEAARRAQSEGAHEGPREGALALRRRPRLEVLRDHEAGGEPGLLRLDAPVEQVVRVELLHRARVTDLGHRAHGSDASVWGSVTGWPRLASNRFGPSSPTRPISSASALFADSS